MRRADEMLKWFQLTRVTNRFRMTDRRIKRLFEIIEKNLTAGEEVKIVFPAVAGTKSPYFYKIWNFWGDISALAVTNKGLIMANQSGIIIKIRTSKTVSLEYLNDITKEERILFTTINIDTVKEIINMTLRKKDANKIYTILRHVIFEYRNIEDSTNILGNSSDKKEHDESNEEDKETEKQDSD